MKQVIWQKNRDWFQHNMPESLAAMETADGLEQMKWETDIQGQMNLLVPKVDHKFYLHSCYDRQREYEQLTAGLSQRHRTLILVGCIEADMLRRIAQEFPNIIHLVLVEPDWRVLYAYLHRWTLQESVGNFSKVSFLLGKPEAEMDIWIRDVFVKGTLNNSIIFITGSVNYQWHYPGYFEKIRKKMVEWIRFQKVNINTIEHFKELWLANNWMNLRYCEIEAGYLLDIFRGRPVIIVAAGPSLDKNIHLLEQAKEKAILIAVGSAMTVLEAKGIRPHFRFALDGGQPQERLFASMKDQKVPLLFSEHLYHSVLPAYEGDKIHIFLQGSSPIISYLYQLAQIPAFFALSGFSVANAAASFAAEAGSREIVFVGQDLAYSKGRLHAEGAWDNQEEENYIHKTYERKDIFGNSVYTDAPFEGMREIFEYIIQSNPHIAFTNATEGGIAIAGAVNRKLEELLAEWEPVSESYEVQISNKINELKQSGVQQQERLKEAAAKLLTKINLYLKKMQHAKKFIDRQEQATPKHLRKISKLVGQLEQFELYQLIEFSFQNAFQLRREGYLAVRAGQGGITPEVELYRMELEELIHFMSLWKQAVEAYLEDKPLQLVIIRDSDQQREGEE